jgi:hypothetical protein
MDLDNEELEATRKLNEKTSDDIFKELGYEIVEIGNGTEYYLDDGREEEKGIAILINPETKKPEIWVDDVISIEELKAIYKKCQEEGWI